MSMIDGSWENGRIPKDRSGSSMPPDSSSRASTPWCSPTRAVDPLCDQWPLATFPALDDRPKQLRLLIFTCAGGHDGLGKHLPVATRVRLLKRGLSFKPQAVIANGDHVYWDLRTRRSTQSGASAEAAVIAGRFDRTAPVLGSPNEAVLKKAVGPQIIPLYATLCRSTPVFFMQDDHDYFENDEADDHFISFPPDHFMMAAGRASQHLYYPEFLPDPPSSEPTATCRSFRKPAPAGRLPSPTAIRTAAWVAATLVRPGEKVISISGDGGFLFSAMELETAVRLNSHLVHMIWIDGTYDMVAEQEVIKYGRESGIEFGPVDPVKYAEAFGATGLMIRTADEIASVLKKALDTPGPVIMITETIPISSKWWTTTPSTKPALSDVRQPGRECSRYLRNTASQLVDQDAGILRIIDRNHNKLS
jgi:hypothetical protein